MARELTDAERTSGLSFAQKALIAGAIGLCVAPAVQALTRRRHAQLAVQKTEDKIDKTLKDSFPASDPPASHFVDIPSNRL